MDLLVCGRGGGGDDGQGREGRKEIMLITLT